MTHGITEEELKDAHDTINNDPRWADIVRSVPIDYYAVALIRKGKNGNIPLPPKFMYSTIRPDDMEERQGV